EGALEQGMGFDGSSITGFNAIEESDMIAMPDASTFATLPYRPREQAVARMFCDVLVPGGEPYEGDPRYVLRRALDRARSMAVSTMTYRILVKEIAHKHGYYATFMPKPLYGENGSGMHTHQSLFRGEENAFFDPDDQYYLSDVAKGFIAGQLHHARELCCVF